MKRLLPLLLLASCSRTPDDPTLPQWSKGQIESLRHWAQAAPLDALPRFDTAELERAADGWDGVVTRRAATALAERLATAHLRGCAAPGERNSWLIEDSGDGADLRGRLRQALETGDSLDAFFASLKPAHPQYGVLQAAFASEIDPARRLTLARNLERWRWMPQSLGEDYVLANVPLFEVGLWRRGEQVKSWPTVVGKTGTPTPTFASEIVSVTFNPWWEVPPSIVREGGISGRRGYVQTRSGRFRQPPGPRNALGRIKVEMPNKHAVFLHDTPSRGLFSAAYRAYSHGCVRVGDAIGFAATLLEGTRTRDEVDVLAGIKKPENEEKLSRPQALALLAKPKAPEPIKTVNVPLSAKLPVYIAYFTAAADKEGALHFAKDVYRRDAVISDPTDPARHCWSPDASHPSVMRYTVEGEDRQAVEPEAAPQGERRRWRETSKARQRL